MGDVNPIRNLRDYSKPGHEGYRNTIELPVRNNVVNLQSDTIWLVKNGCSFNRLWSEDPNKHLKDFLKLVDSHDLDGENKERTHLRTTFDARVRDYMAAHTERIEIFENTIFKQQEEINDRMAIMFGLLKELTTSMGPKKVLIREEAKSPVTKNVNSISLDRGEEEKNENDDMAADGGINGTRTEMLVKEDGKETKAENGSKNKQIKRAEKEETVEVSSSQPVGYYLKHNINEKLIEGLVDIHRFNDSLSRI
nr:MAK10-like protein [Tanacetum cinerariifolium]